MGMTEEIINKVCEYAEGIFTCGPRSIHGVAHWRKVDEAGVFICRETGADLTVVRFFAFLHDSCRLNDGRDREHGPRAADRLAELPEELAVLDSDQMALLSYAIRHHTDGKVSDEPTIGACWDSDRMDLGRIGIVLSAERMSTEVGKRVCGCVRRNAQSSGQKSNNFLNKRQFA